MILRTSTDSGDWQNTASLPVLPEPERYNATPVRAIIDLISSDPVDVMWGVTAMNEYARIDLTPTQMRQLARYELTFQDVLPADFLYAMVEGEFEVETEEGVVDETANMFNADAYPMSLEDLVTALHNMQSADPTIHAFREYWYEPMTCVESLFQLDQAIGYDEEHASTWAGYVMEMARASYDFADIWLTLQSVCEYENGDDRLSEVLDFSGIYQDLARHAANRTRPVAEWIFSTQEMERYLRPIEDNDALMAEATEEERELARTMIEEFIQTNSTRALHIKGYSCYGGNALYDCDWPASRDCMMRLYDLTDDPNYANTLGYIYYYGRCNDGVPEYDKAFSCYQVAAANGLLEGMYKLADMYWHGYACKQSPRTAYNLYSMVYTECYRQYLSDPMGNFADAALRMGNVYAQGIYEEADPEQAYHYYLQAEYAARQRAENTDFFGSRTVVLNAQQALERIRQDLPEDYFRPSIDYYVPRPFYDLAYNRYRCELRCTQLDGQTWELRGYRIKPGRGPEPECILLTVPEINLCVRTTAVTMTAVNVIGIWFAGDTTFRYDAVSWNEDEDRYEFYYEDSIAAWIQCHAYRMKARPAGEPYGPEYRLVSICFQPGGRTYDYICDLADVQVGDTVIVNGYNGETAVEVVAIRTVRESELALPVERYKRVVRRAN